MQRRFNPSIGTFSVASPCTCRGRRGVIACAPQRRRCSVEILLNPKRHDRAYPDERSREVMRKTIEFFETQGQATAQGGLPRARLVRRLPRLREAREDLRDHVHARRLRRRGRALGHLAHLRVRRDPRLLRPAVLVHLAGLRARPRPDLDEPQRGGRSSAPRGCSRTARSSPSASRRRRTAPTSTRPT